MGQSWGPRNGATPSSCGMAWSPQTFLRTATDVRQSSQSVSPLTVKRVASSERVTTISVTGYQTCLAKPSPPPTCVTTSSSTQVAPGRGQRPRQPGQTETAANQHRNRQRSRNRRETFLSGTSGNRGPKVFTTCML